MLAHATGLVRSTIARHESKFTSIAGARARGLTDELRAWCRSETDGTKNYVIGEVGLDLIAGQQRLVAQSHFDILSGQDY